MPDSDTEIIADLPNDELVSDLPGDINTVKDKRHWWNLTTVTDTTLDLEVTHDHQLIVLNAATSAATLNLPASDSSSAGQGVRYYVKDATNVATIARDGSDTINGAGANLTPATNATGVLVSLGDGNWAHLS